MIVIGSGPAGQKAAIQAAKFRRRVALVERRHMVGGVCTNTGTIPSKTLREAVLYLTGWHQRGVYGASYRVKDEIGVDDLFQRTHHVIEAEIEVIRDQLTRNHVQIVTRRGPLRRPAHHRGAGLGGQRAHAHRRVDRGRGRHRPGPSGRRGVRRSHRARLRRHPRPRQDPRVAGGRGRRRDRHRVRLDVRRARHQGDRRREAPPPARLLRRPDGRGAAVPPPRARRHVPVRRAGGGCPAARRRLGDRARERQADPVGRRLLRRRPRGRDARARPREGRPRARRPGPDRGRRPLPDSRPAHLRGG